MWLEGRPDFWLLDPLGSSYTIACPIESPAPGSLRHASYENRS